MSTDTTTDEAVSPETRQLATRNFLLQQQFMRAMLTDDALNAEVPDGAMLVLLPDHDPELATANLRAGVAAAEHGLNVYLRHVAAEGPR